MFAGNNRKSEYQLISLGIAFCILMLINLSAIQSAFAAKTIVAAKTTVKQTFARQDLSELKHQIEEFLTAQTIGYAGNVSVRSGNIDPQLKLAACAALEVFLPSGSRAWGKTSVGVRCHAPKAWRIYVQANISIKTQYIVAATPLARGHVMTAQDIVYAEGDLTRLPAGVFTDLKQAIGRTVTMPVAAGSILRPNVLKQALAVQQGQAVLLTSSGNGFTVTAEGQALKNANIGQVVPVKVAGGQVVNGIAKSDGKVEVVF